MDAIFSFYIRPLLVILCAALGFAIVVLSLGIFYWIRHESSVLTHAIAHAIEAGAQAIDRENQRDAQRIAEASVHDRW